MYTPCNWMDLIWLRSSEPTYHSQVESRCSLAETYECLSPNICLVKIVFADDTAMLFHSSIPLTVWRASCCSEFNTFDANLSGLRFVFQSCMCNVITVINSRRIPCHFILTGEMMSRDVLTGDFHYNDMRCNVSKLPISLGLIKLSV